MPYIKKRDLEQLLKAYYMAGCVTGYGFDHELSINEQEEQAFDEYHKSQQNIE